jgi:hypothetical protein
MAACGYLWMPVSVYGRPCCVPGVSGTAVLFLCGIETGCESVYGNVMHSLPLATLCSLALVLTSSAQAGERPLLAVLDLDGTQSKLSAAELQELTETARKGALDHIGKRYGIITRENLVDLLKSHGKTLEKCQGECETETGRLIGADVVVSGTVRRVFGRYRVGLKLHGTSPPSLMGIEKGDVKGKHKLPGLITRLMESLCSANGKHASSFASTGAPARTKPSLSPDSRRPRQAEGDLTLSGVPGIGESTRKELMAPESVYSGLANPWVRYSLTAVSALSFFGAYGYYVSYQRDLELYPAPRYHIDSSKPVSSGILVAIGLASGFLAGRGWKDATTVDEATAVSIGLDLAGDSVFSRVHLTW